MANVPPTTLDRLRHFRAMMSDQKEQLTDEEYQQYLAGSESFCGRLWANLNNADDLFEASITVSDLYESFTEEDGDRAVAEDRRLSLDFADEILSSTFIIGDDSDLEYFDLMDEAEQAVQRTNGLLEEFLSLRLGGSRPTTNPCA